MTPFSDLCYLEATAASNTSFVHEMRVTYQVVIFACFVVSGFHLATAHFSIQYGCDILIDKWQSQIRKTIKLTAFIGKQLK